MKKDWTYKKLGEVGTVVTGSTPSTKDNMNYSSQDVCFFKPSDLSSDSLVKLSKSEFYISKHAFEHSRKLPKGSVLTTCIGIIGKVGILTEEATCNQQINAIIPNPDIIISDFLGYSIMSKKHILQASANAPVVPLLNKTQFSKLSIPIPPLSIQRSIVSELDLLHSVISKKQEQLRALDNLAQSLFYQMFGDPITNPMGWQVKKLGEVCVSELGKTLNQSKDTGVLRPYLCAINISWGRIDTTNLKQTRFEDYELDRYSVQKGDLLICEGGDTGRAAIWEKDMPMLYQNALHRVRFNDNVLAVYALYWLHYLKMKGEIDNKYSKGVTIKHLVKSSLLSIPLPLPPLSLQQSFAAKVSAIEEKKRFITQSIKDVESLLAQRMDHYFG